jgi:hypothetical protein
MPSYCSQNWSRNSTKALYFSIYAWINGVKTYIPAYQYLQAINVLIPLRDAQGRGGAISGTITLYDHYSDLITGNVLAAFVNLPMTISWCWTDDPNPPPVFSVTVTHIAPSFSRTGTRGLFTFIQGIAAQSTLDKTAGPRAFAAGFTISQIFTQIAQSFQWQYLVEPSNVADTNTVPLIVPGQATMFDFISQTLLPLARNANNEPFNFYFDIDGVAHFHSDRYLALETPPPQGTNPQLSWKYLYGDDYTGDCISFLPLDNILNAGQTGGTDSTLVGIDSQSGAATEYASQNEGGPNLNDGSPVDTAGVGWSPDESTVPNTRYNNQRYDQSYLISTLRVNSQALANISRLHMRSRYSQYAEATVMGTHFVRVNDFVSVRSIDYNGIDSYLSGVFEVQCVEHMIDTTGWHTKFTLRRLGQPEVSDGNQITVNRTSTLTDPGNLILGPTPDYG